MPGSALRSLAVRDVENRHFCNFSRAWDPQQGEIRFNDVPLSGFSEAALRKTVSVVPQRVHLFSATLRDNLLLAAPDASDDTLRAMLEQVGLHKLLEDDGLNSWLGEGVDSFPAANCVVWPLRVRCCTMRR